MSVFDSLFGGNTTTQTTSNQLTGAATNAATNLFERATNVANQPYEAYGGNRVAPFNPTQQTGFNNAQGIAANSANIGGVLNSTVLDQLTGGRAKSNYEMSGLADDIAGLGRQGADRTTALATTLPNTDLTGYMNPYTQAVLDPALEDLARRADLQRNQMNANAARTGSFGGSRNMLGQMELERNTMGEMGRLSANERARAYNEAVNQFRTDQRAIPAMYAAAQGLQGAGMQGYTNLGAYQLQGQNALQSLLGANASRLGPEVNSLLATGGLQQALDQAGLDVNYQNFVEQRDWPLRGLSALGTSLGTGGPYSSTATRTTEAPRPNAIGQVIGAGTGLLGSLGGVGGSALSGLGGLASSGWNWLTGGGGTTFDGLSQGGGFGSFATDLGSGGGLADIAAQDYGSYWPSW
jgi:hypothetical protein